MRRPGLRLLLALAGALAFAAAGCAREEASVPRHVVLISLDTTRADHLGCYGATRPATPAIDRLAARGVRFADVTAPALTTLPSHVSMMTGTWPHTHGVARNGYTVNPDNAMLAERFREAGFHTAAFLGSFSLASRFGFDQGFEHFDERFDLLVTAERDQNQRTADRVTAAVLEHVDAAPGERLFLFVHYFDPHAPYAPPPEYARRFVEDGAPLASGSDDVEAAAAAHREAILPPEPGARPRLRLVRQGMRDYIEHATGEPSGSDEWLAALYAGEVAFLDAAIGDLLHGLETRGILDDALVVLTGDHGETFWEHGDFWNHGRWVYQTTAAIPLILSLPDGAAAGTVVETPVSTVDLAPTLLAIFALAPRDGMDGVDLTPAIRGEDLERGPVFCQATQPPIRNPAAGQWENADKPACVRSGPWKYVRARQLEMEQLFDLHRDPEERRDLLREFPLPPDASRALSELRGAMDRWEATAHPLPSRYDPSQFEDTLRRLRSLGYFETEDRSGDPGS